MLDLDVERDTTNYENVVSADPIRYVCYLQSVARDGNDWVIGLHDVSHRILDLEGMGREIWKGIDPKDYIEGLRKEWDAD